ncbi:MAG: helix-turn-helix transcriptional regulator [Ruminococcus sp.]|nr:helix-turn-helix transcriptional regulator [Ruminococcus sp.]
MDKDSIQYIERVVPVLKKLKIKQKDVADLLGLSEEHVSRIFRGECGIKEEYRKIIDDLIEERSSQSLLYSMPEEDFRHMLEKLLKEFDGVITQDEIAKAAGFSGQPQISRIRKGIRQLTAEEKHNLLSVFLRLCIFQDNGTEIGFHPVNVYTDHYDTACELYFILYEESCLFDEFDSYKEKEFSNFAIKMTLINYFMSLPYQAQELILDHPSAFFDSLQILNYDKYTDCYSDTEEAIYPSAARFLGEFNKLSHERRVTFQFLFEKLCAEGLVFSYRDDDFYWEQFDMITQYRKMERSARDRRIKDSTVFEIGKRDNGYEPECSYSIDDLKDREKDKAVNKDKQFHRFEAVIHDLINFDRTHYASPDDLTDVIIDDIDYRLTMSPYEWHIWMLYASYVFVFQEDDSIYKLMQETAEGKYDHTDPGLPDISQNETEGTLKQFTDIIHSSASKQTSDD